MNLEPSTEMNTMKKFSLLRTIILIALSLFVSSLTQAQDRNLLGELYGQALREQAESGDPRAQTALGDEYQMGVGAAKTPDLAKAAHWYQRAAEKGFAKAQNYLGEAYKLGRGVPQDFSKAASWYRRAANHLTKDVWSRSDCLSRDPFRFA
jgi:Sel1 repeat